MAARNSVPKTSYGLWPLSKSKNLIKTFTSTTIRLMNIQNILSFFQISFPPQNGQKLVHGHWSSWPPIHGSQADSGRRCLQANLFWTSLLHPPPAKAPSSWYWPPSSSRVRKSENFPDSKIFVTKTLQIKCVNEIATNSRKRCVCKF